MLGNIRIRFLLVIVIAAVLSFMMQSEHTKRQVEPVLNYVMATDYNLEELISVFLKTEDHDTKIESTTTSSPVVLQFPCEFISIKKNYGWYWDIESNKQVFYPGVYLQVKENSPVRAICAGKVQIIEGNAKERKIVINHSDDLFSVYGQLQEVLIENNAEITQDIIIGKTGQEMYFELRDKNGPVSPMSLFN